MAGKAKPFLTTGQWALIDSLEDKTRRVPFVGLVVLLVAAFGMACLPEWPVHDGVPTKYFENGHRVPRSAWTPQVHQSIARAESKRNSERLRQIWRQDVVPTLVLNGVCLVIAVFFAVMLAQGMLPRGVGIFPARAVLGGVTIGVLLGGVLSGACRMFNVALGQMNATVPAGLFLVVLCPVAATAFVASWKTRDLTERCVKCGYTLRGLPKSVCPECGTAYVAMPAVEDATREQ